MLVEGIAEKTDQVVEKTTPVIENIVDKVVEVAKEVKDACHEKVVETAKQIVEEESGENKDVLVENNAPLGDMAKEVKPVIESNGEHAENVAVSTN